MSHDPTHRHPDDAHRADTERLADQLAHETEKKETAVAGRTRKLADTAAELIVTVGELTAEVSALDRRTNRNRRATMLALVGLVLDLGLSAIVFIALHGQLRTADRLGQEIARQESIRRGALCPLYGLLVLSESPAARERYARGPEAYDQAFADLKTAYAVLSCES